MIDFTLHNENTAPKESKSLLKSSQQTNGFIPNLHAIMAEAPGLLATYQFAHEQFINSSFNNDEKMVVWQTINVENDAHYCVPADTAIAKSTRVDPAITKALRDHEPLPNARLEKLRTFTASAVHNRGQVDFNAVKAILAAGYSKRQVLEVILGVAQKVMSNYTNMLAQTPLDDAFSPFEWKTQRKTGNAFDRYVGAFPEEVY
jgi:alkylhydroperoxidase family enzyme